MTAKEAGRAKAFTLSAGICPQTDESVDIRADCSALRQSVYNLIGSADSISASHTSKGG